MNSTAHVDAAALKQQLPAYLNAIGHPPVFHASGNRLTARCPLHPDKKPSLSAVLEGGVWKWFCHPCDSGGTVIELHAALSGRNTGTEFKMICEEVAAHTGLFSGVTTASPACHAVVTAMPKASKAMDGGELERLTTPWRTRLQHDSALCEAFARELELAPDTLRRLTTPSLDAFGITPPGFTLLKADGTSCTLRRARLAYIGDGGYKIRDPFGTGTPRFWKVGELRRPWRSHRLLCSAPAITDVHLVESESTAAALIEAGFENPFHEGTCVVATSGCHGFDPAWLPLFAGRLTHYWPDNDDAGLRFFEETATLLHGTARGSRKHRLPFPPIP